MQNVLAITNVNVVDVNGGSIRPSMTVTIEGETIRAVEEHQGAVLHIGVERIPGDGLYLIPGLVDSHVHYLDPGGFGPPLLANGIVLARDMGTPTEQAIQMREGLRQGLILGPEIITTGSVLDGDPPQIPPIAVACATPEGGRDAVRRQARSGVDQIKVYSDLDRETYLAIVAEARGHSLKPVGHVPEAVSIEEAAEAGQASCEHLFGFEKIIARLLCEPVPLQKGGMGAYAAYWLRLPEVDPASLQQALQPIRASGMVVCPTVVVFRSRGRAPEIVAGTYPRLGLVSPLVRSIWDMLWDPHGGDIKMSRMISPHLQAFVYQLYRAGIPLIAGTDLLVPGIIPGFSLHEELLLWQEAGIPPIDVLRAATIGPARFFGLDHRFGTVEAGKTASLALVQANPLDDIRGAGKIAGVFLRGRYFDRYALDHMLIDCTAASSAGVTGSSVRAG